jgi:ACDE family multidrug resistance protein
VLATGHRLLGKAEAGLVEGTTPDADDSPVAPHLQLVGAPAPAGRRPVVVAVGAAPDADDVVRAAAGIARRTGAPLEVVRLRETAVVEELAIDVEPQATALAALTGHVENARSLGVGASGLLLHSVGDHAAAARALARHADDEHARVVAIGSSPRRRAALLTEGSFTATLAREVPCTLVLLHAESELEADDLAGPLAAQG